MKSLIAEACGNTFVLFDCLEHSSLDREFYLAAHSCLVQAQKDDALILKEGKLIKGALYARMIVLGLDGAFGEFCGNGARVCAAYLFYCYPHIKQFYLKTHLGEHPLTQYSKDVYSVQLPREQFEINKKFIVSVELFKRDFPDFRYVEIIEPHLTLNAEMSSEELFLIGQKLNQRKDIFPLGINVNAYHLLKDGVLSVKTYERGVQRLTQSCGTGSIACAVCCNEEGTFQISTQGGFLEVILYSKGIELKGPAAFS